jgi:hypothetical protein
VLWNLKDVLPALSKLFGHLITALRFAGLDQEIKSGSVITSIKASQNAVEVDTCPTEVLIEHPETEVVVVVDDIRALQDIGLALPGQQPNPPGGRR